MFNFLIYLILKEFFSFFHYLNILKLFHLLDIGGNFLRIVSTIKFQQIVDNSAPHQQQNGYLNNNYLKSTPGTRVGPGFRDRKLAVKSKKNRRKSAFVKKKYSF